MRRGGRRGWMGKKESDAVREKKDGAQRKGGQEKSGGRDRQTEQQHMERHKTERTDERMEPNERRRGVGLRDEREGEATSSSPSPQLVPPLPPRPHFEFIHIDSQMFEHLKVLWCTGSGGSGLCSRNSDGGAPVRTPRLPCARLPKTSASPGPPRGRGQPNVTWTLYRVVMGGQEEGNGRGVVAVGGRKEERGQRWGIEREGHKRPQEDSEHSR
ncbi:hypothetical protein INR49_004468 [Caranx melampygus]|nr:hypothetical protein INR49_004468 [Caranx melampygus]